MRLNTFTLLLIFSLTLFPSLVSKTILIKVDVTAYNAEKGQTDDSPFTTASNQRVREGIIAISRDLEEDYGLSFGDKVFLVGIGVFEVQDRMNRRWKRKVDIFMWSKKEALKFGRKETKMLIELKEGA